MIDRRLALAHGYPLDALANWLHRGREQVAALMVLLMP